MAPAPPKTLISYNRADRDWAEWMAGVIKGSGYEPILDVWHFRPGENWVLRMQEAAAQANLTLAVFSEAYLLSANTQSEWAAAFAQDPIGRDRRLIPVRVGKCDLTGMLRSIIYIDLIDLDERDAERALLDGLRSSGEPTQPPRFPGERKKPFAAAAPFPLDLARLHGVPELPPHYLPREADLAELKQKLLARANVGITGQSSAVGVQGMGGIGKSVLAVALARDSGVRQAFPDGIYWLTIGQTPNLLDLQNQLLRQLTGSREPLTTEPEAKDALRETLEGRAALVVLDDVWNVDHADAFSVTAPPARLLITTRNNEVLLGLDAEEHQVEVLSPSDAVRMLADWVGQKSRDMLPMEAAEVAKECGYLPLALAMIGAMIRSKSSPGPASASLAWKDALGRLRRADLGAIKRAFPGYPYPDLLRAIEVSIAGLEAADQERYLDLAVFPEDQPIPEGALRVLWNLDEIDTRDCMTHLVARSLATWATDGSNIILRDLQRIAEDPLPSLTNEIINRQKSTDSSDELPATVMEAAEVEIHAHAQQTEQRSLGTRPTDGLILILHDLQRDLIHKRREKELPALHRRLVEVWNALPKLPDDYAWRRVAYHMVKAGRKDDLRRLLLDFNYLQKKLIAVGPNALIADYEYLRDDKDFDYLPDDKDFQVVQAAIRLSAEVLARDSRQLAGQLIGRLLGHRTPRIQALANQATERKAWPWLRPLTPSLIAPGGRTPEGHRADINDVAITLDGRRVISGSGDQKLRVWDLKTGQTLRILEGHTGRVRAVAVTPDGRRAVSGARDNRLRVWDLESGQTLRTLEGHTDDVNAVAVTPDSCRAVSGSDDRTLRLWDLESGQTIRTLEGHTEGVWTVTIMPNGQCALSGARDNTLRLWDLESGQTIRLLEAGPADVSAVAITPDGRCALSGARDSTLRVWDLETGQTIHTLEGHQSKILAVTVIPNSRRAISASGSQSGTTRYAFLPSGDFTLRVWDLATGQTIHTLDGHTKNVNAVAVTLDGYHVVSASWDNTVRMWDLRNWEKIAIFTGEACMESCAIAPDGWTIVAGDESGRVHFLRLVEADETKPPIGDTKIQLLHHEQAS
jgi:WD40 repeat protein